jgi:predicted MPP superfamily phosphohydrolase
VWFLKTFNLKNEAFADRDSIAFRQKFMRYRGNFILGLTSVFMSILLLSCAVHASLRTVYYDAPLSPYFENRTLTIVLISDLHSDIYGNDQSPLLRRIIELSPDIIVLSGDIFDDIAPPIGTRLLLYGIKKALPEIPVFYVTGNHEYDSGKADEVKQELSDSGVNVLSDTYMLLEINGIPLLIAGVEDPNIQLWDPLYDPNSAGTVFKAVPGIDAYKILLCHRPEIAKYYTDYGFALILSGHTHGGQVRLPPLMNGLYAPGQGLFPKYAGGVYKTVNRTGGGLIVVSRGLTTRRPLLPRIFNPPELVVIRLNGYTNLKDD